MILVTGGAGFIGSNFILEWTKGSNEPIVNIDKLTYAGNRGNLQVLDSDSRHIFIVGDICDSDLIKKILFEHQPRAIINLAAESHVDRSILGPTEFFRTNVQGTFNLLECARHYYAKLSNADKKSFRFLHISTDEVYGSLGPNDQPFTELTSYAPNSPYSASKAASDHFVRAYYHTYSLPTITTNCSNNYGPFQFPEKLIPLIIMNALQGKSLPVYGDGQNIRDWLYVTDHCAAIRLVLEKGVLGTTYCIGGINEKNNLQVVHTICSILDELKPISGGSYSRLITFVKDRPGHDRRYAINPEKIINNLQWKPEEIFETGIRKTVQWYLDNAEWVENIKSGQYQNWIETNYKQRAK